MLLQIKGCPNEQPFINFKNMDFIQEVVDKINIVNEVLLEMGQSPLLENTDFVIDEMSKGSWLKVDIVDTGRNNVPLAFIFSKSGLSVRIDRIDEAIDLSDVLIRKSSTQVKAMLKDIFTCSVLVKYYGSVYTVMKFYGKDGSCTKTFRCMVLFLDKPKQKERLYLPIYN